MTDKLLTDWSTASLGKSTTADNKRTVFYVQPLIAHYRMEVIESLSRLFAVKLFASSAGMESNGFSREKPACAEFVETQISHVFSPGINMQREVVGRILRERPAAVLMFADIRYLSLWLALAAGRAMRIPVLIHGQGLYRHEEDVGLIRGLCYRIAVALSTQYICYTDASKRSLESGSAFVEKLLGVTKFEQAIALQQDFAKSTYEGFVAEVSKLGELYANVAKEAFKPVEGAIAKVKASAN